MKMLVKQKLVKYWNSQPSQIEQTCLANALAIGTYAATTEYPNGFFSEIYIPVKVPTEDGMPEDYTYVNIGVDTDEMAEIYATLYDGLYLIEPLLKVSTDPYDYTSSIGQLARRIKSVFNLNKGKYLKLIEAQGYAYNPLFNVDGTEEFTFIEKEGDITNTTGNKLGAVTQKTNTYDGTLRDASKTEYESLGAGNDNNSESTTTISHTDLTETADTDLYGNTSVAADKYHTERKLRQGNIGVTKSTELIEAQRDVVRYSILQEFFDDINKQILIEIYD